MIEQSIYIPMYKSISYLKENYINIWNNGKRCIYKLDFKMISVKKKRNIYPCMAHMYIQ